MKVLQLQERSQPSEWCRDYRLEIMRDIFMEVYLGYTIVECVDGMHKGSWIAWAPDGKCAAVGTVDWVYTKVKALHTSGTGT